MQKFIDCRGTKPQGSAAPYVHQKPPSQAELLARLAEANRKVDAMLINDAIRAALRASDERVKELLAKTVPKPRRRSRTAFPRWDD